jgi:hypothetical protein
MTLARELGGAPVVVAQAARAAILTIAVADGQVGPDRLVDAVIGAGVALALSQLLFTPEPVRLLRRAESAALSGMASGLLLTARGFALEDADGMLTDLGRGVDRRRRADERGRVRPGRPLLLHIALRKEVVITFKQSRWVPVGLSGYDRPDRLHIGFGPDRLRMDFNLNGVGDPFTVDPVTIEASFGPGDLPSYGEVLAGVFDGDPALSVRGNDAVQGVGASSEVAKGVAGRASAAAGIPGGQHGTIGPRGSRTGLSNPVGTPNAFEERRGECRPAPALPFTRRPGSVLASCLRSIILGRTTLRPACRGRPWWRPPRRPGSRQASRTPGYRIL